MTHKKLYFTDYRHFLGNQTLINTNDQLGSFRLLPYYTYSADRWYTELHAEQHFLGLVLGRLPLINKLNWQEVAGAHFLANNKLKYYYEINLGLENIFRILRVDYVMAYSADRGFNQGLMVGINLRF